ncbi:MAG: peptide deformylase, partial [Clostridia bacterium]|nr:peptide deformylase [Clostridia bacterium]
MAIREIVKRDEESILRKKCRKVEKFDDKLAMILDDMIDTVKAADGLGLAAPQIGILRQIIVIDADEEMLEIINPEIIK